MTARRSDPRYWFLALLVISWLVMLVLMWREFWTLPSPELLERRREVQPPTMRSLFGSVVRALAELAVLLVLLWPGRLYRTRVAGTALLLVAWFVFTVPMTISSVEQVHRRWLAAVFLALPVVLLASLAAALVRRFRAPDP